MEGPRDDHLADRLGYFMMSSHVMAKKKKVSFCTDAVLGIVVNFVSVRPKFPKSFGLSKFFEIIRFRQ